MSSIVMHTRTDESIRPLSNDERRGTWSAKWFTCGLHRRPEKPRIRVVTVPAPLTKETKHD